MKKKRSYNIKVLMKLALKKLGFNLDSFCKKCGRKVHDFSAPDIIWLEVRSRIWRGNILCYDCFCEYCKELNLPCVYRLKPLEEYKTEKVFEEQIIKVILENKSKK